MNRRDIRKEIARFILPIISENVLQLSAGIVSTAMIGRLLATDISAQGACIRITDTLWGLFRGISIGVMILVAKAYRQQDGEKTRHIISQAYQTGLLIAGLAMVLLGVFARDVLSFFSTDEEILSKAVRYMRIIVFSLPFVLSSSLVSASFHALGDTRTPMLIASLLNLVNILLGWMLIFGLLFFPVMGIAGAAIALLIAQAAAALLGLVLLTRKLRGEQKSVPDKRKLFWDKGCIKDIYAIGIPAALESMFWQFSAILLSKMILVHGANQFAAYQIGLQAELITEMPAVAFGTATTALVAKGLADSDRRLGKAYFEGITRLVVQYSLVTSLLLVFLSSTFMRWMTSNLALIPIGATYVMIMGFIQIPQNVSKVFNGTLRSAGYKQTPMLIAGAGIWGFRIPLCALVTYVLKLDIVYIWIIIALDQMLRFCISAWLLRRDRARIFPAYSEHRLESNL